MAGMVVVCLCKPEELYAMYGSIVSVGWCSGAVTSVAGGGAVHPTGRWAVARRDPQACVARRQQLAAGWVAEKECVRHARSRMAVGRQQ